MNSTTNSLTFGASINNFTKVKNKNAFNSVISEFEKATKKFPKDTLYITETKNGADSWHITDKKRGDFYKGEEIFTTSIDDHIEKLGVKKFAKELINTFNAMKYERVIYKKAKPIKIDIDKTKGLITAYQNMAEAYKTDGNALMAKRYNYLAQRNSDKLSKLTLKLNEYIVKYKNKIQELSKNYPEIGQVELYIV